MFRLIFILFLLLLIGCSNSESYQLKLIKLEPLAKIECNKHGQKFLMVHSPDLETYNAVCIQESPIAKYEYKIE